MLGRSSRTSPALTTLRDAPLPLATDPNEERPARRPVRDVGADCDRAWRPVSPERGEALPVRPLRCSGRPERDVVTE
ncbi:hypothetical protein C3Y87_04935 [Carbonactinospora thermoautotrophica]|nr:hypothetical protein [Carbonactinospora thermoautotrophica]